MDYLFRLRYSWNGYDDYDIAMDYRVGLSYHTDFVHDSGVSPQTGLTDVTVWNYHLDLLNVTEGNNFQHSLYVLGTIRLMKEWNLIGAIGSNGLLVSMDYAVPRL